MADGFLEIDSEGVYVGISLRDFGVRVSAPREDERLEMPRDQLRESIAHLREELSAGEPLSPEDRAQLESVLGEVSGILESDGKHDAGSGGKFDELPSLVRRFESTHPKLAVVLGRIADSLSQLGI
jgi:acyl-coenzyme A synthetase/AMP-(fatty) acid ligase